MDAQVSFFTNHPPSEEELAYWLEPGSVEKDRQLFDRAYAAKIENPGPRLHLRFLLELSNVCSRDCLYCGVRRSNREIERYSLQPEVAMEVLRRAKSRGYCNIVLQAGERSDKTFTRAVTRLVEELRREGGEDFRIVLSLGEQPAAAYRDWKQAGADRYLLRIETSNPELYRKIHPPGSAYTLGARLRSLEALREAGFQTGTGVMIGLPFQKLRD
ncbi:MAG: radical SAM protein, partial [Bacteroidales bacterium]